MSTSAAHAAAFSGGRSPGLLSSTCAGCSESGFPPSHCHRSSCVAAVCSMAGAALALTSP
eukprot:CAMPEP_0181223762 /NCGR_PEP_ID=MMETSP1096-20121128/30731_1 /TAXON_ID=156174 ORGANISM="Chrysochromulina ericina, Strain CCMP281" /NCGR_SAMPLE_ID=MMETSP1096 /ASSEMBLY_ACC=CAM_ASM_000453 /LENGTH=59 /DNA_ID=CAMNT_0023316729 /DNA_START=613 /DNA_END=789 /DNA_ORIENTATION=-